MKAMEGGGGRERECFALLCPRFQMRLYKTRGVKSKKNICKSALWPAISIDAYCILPLVQLCFDMTPQRLAMFPLTCASTWGPSSQQRPTFPLDSLPFRTELGKSASRTAAQSEGGFRTPG